MKKGILLLITISTLIKVHAQTVTDIDGNVYGTVTIGTQVWMKENLEVTRYGNGDSIGTTFPATEDIGADTAPKYQWPYAGDEINVSTYGRLYTWYVVTDDRGLCPADWHVPSDAEWTTLFNFLGGEDAAGAAMKESGTNHWMYPNTGASNSSDFTGLPGGYRNTDFFNHLGTAAFWWSSSEAEMNSQWKPSVSYMDSDVNVYGNAFRTKSLGFSVRCIRDESSSGLNNFENQNINIFPSPAIDKISIHIGHPQKCDLSIYSVTGTLVLQTQITDEGSTIDISALTPGIYFIQLSSPDGIAQQKWIKQ
jgi:uncharacterized protein (TIGR02145 family)